MRTFVPGTTPAAFASWSVLNGILDTLGAFVGDMLGAFVCDIAAAFVERTA
jgi:hypothetical protein